MDTIKKVQHALKKLVRKGEISKEDLKLIEFERGRNHPRWRVSNGGNSVRRSFSGSPGDRNSLKNTVKDIQQALHKLR
ncbi:MAG: hypothetical protein GDA36_06800 [Rhodobacteraceae bacterium]|nr:hypothetical protein [Paracoccaceae bacterium]